VFFRFPAHETISGASKIPTIIYYDLEGNVMAVGAEAAKEGVHEASLEGNWHKAEWSV
jgi:radical SAM superfamily enzyme with C-terminal helix-hairpin-helix motif